MHAYLIIGQADKFIQNFKAKKTEFSHFAKVDDVRELSKFTKFKLSEKTAIILKDFDKANETAQNAFLKALEEPQENLTYILTSTNIDRVLPTIISRCEVVEVASSKQQVAKEDKENVNKFIDGNIGERLNIISKINKRDEAIEFIKNLILVSHEEVLENPKSKLQIADEALKTLNNLEVNGNVQLQLTNFVINSNSL